MLYLGIYLLPTLLVLAIGALGARNAKRKGW